MTCYLNSLLQALYMTPEFRNALYNWEFVGMPKEEAMSIPFQLQKLFLSLQVSSDSEWNSTSNKVLRVYCHILTFMQHRRRRNPPLRPRL